MPLSICYYISGHGFGHATRSAQIISSLLQTPSTTITICTLAPTHLFPSSPNITLRKIEVDSNIIQPLPYEIDVISTFQALEDFVTKLDGKDGLDSKSWIERETEFLEENDFDVLIADAPWSVGLLNPTSRKTKGKKPIKIILSNFTFDLIFSSLLTHLPSSTPPDLHTKYQSYCHQIKEAYQNFDYLIRLPGFIDYPFLDSQQNLENEKEPICKTKVLDAPLVYRTPENKTKQQVLKDLSIPTEFHTSKILLIQFGGHSLTHNKTPPHLPPNWICLIPSTSPSSPSSSKSSTTPIFTIPPTTYLPTIISISTAVLGKIGYGTVSECVGMGIPLVYVRRNMFAEEEGLLRFLGREGVGREIGREVFEGGVWGGGVGGLEGMGEEKGCGDGSGEVGDMIRRIVMSGSEEPV